MLNDELIRLSPRPSVNHNVVYFNLSGIFRNYLRGNTCSAFSHGVDVFLTEKDRVVPDMMVVCNPSIIKHNGIHGSPNLVIEVLSPSTAKNDKGYKKDLYERCGVGEYWIVDTNSRSIEVYLLQQGAYVLDNVYTMYPDYLIEMMTDEEKAEELVMEFQTALFPDLTIQLEEVFEKMLG